MYILVFFYLLCAIKGIQVIQVLIYLGLKKTLKVKDFLNQIIYLNRWNNSLNIYFIIGTYET